ncbi:MAG: hypothetical protein H6598_04630 [Flavobacteriales bacterium]|nr:hypothetical protein [Flavobacteriales bacterium]
MNEIISKIGKGGLLIAAMGIISTLLYLFNYNIRLLAWIDLWGEAVGWVIRGGLVVVGGALFFLFGRDEE